MLDQGLSCLAPADQHRGKVGRGVAEAGGGPLEQPLDGEGGERGLLRGFPDHRVATDQGQGGVP